MLSEDIIRGIEDIATRVSFPEGSVLITEGDMTTDFYILLTGKLSVIAKGQFLATRVPGDLIGAISNVHNTSRTATVTAIEDSTALVFKGADFPAFLQLLPCDFVERIGQEVADMLVGVLALLPIFQGVPADSMKKLASLFHFHVYKAGEIVIREGNVGDMFYIILNGTATVTKNIDGDEKYLDTRKSGEWFGDIALIKKTLRTASITAQTDLTCLVLEEAHFDGLLLQLPPSLQKTVHEYAAARTISIIKLIPFFSKFPQEKLELLMTLFHFKVLHAADVLYREGDNASFVLVLRGIINLTKTNKSGIIKSYGTYELNEFFGEDCLLKPDYIFPYDARCVTTCSLLILEPKAFQRYLESFPDTNDIMLAIKHHKLKTSLIGNKTQFSSSNVSDGIAKAQKRGSFEDAVTRARNQKRNSVA